MESAGELVGWFYFTVDYQTVWGFGPFGFFDELVHREYTVPINVSHACD